MEWYDGLRQWADKHNSLIDFTGLMIVIVGGYLALTRQRFGQKPVIDMIANPDNWPLLIAQYRTNGREAYLATLRWLLSLATRIYGPNLLSWQAYGRCLTIAFIYPLIAMLIGWVAANQHSPGGLVLFADDPLWWSRLAKALILIAAMALCWWIIANAERFGHWTVEKLFGPLDDDTVRTGFLAKAVRTVAEYGAFAFAFAVAVAVAFAVAVAGAVAGAGAGVFAVAGAGAGVFAVAGAGAGVFAVAVAVAGAVAVAVAFAILGETELASLWVFFLILLPILNALADMLSLAATRWFLANVAPTPPEGETEARPSASFPRILVQLAPDLGVAVVCLALLIGTITTALDVWASLFPGTLPFDWRAYWTGVQADRSTGWALYLMVGTTLLPTMVHLGAGLGAVLTHSSRLSGRVARRLEQAQAEGTTLLDPEINTLVSQLHRATLWSHTVSATIGLAGLFGSGWVIFMLLG